MGNFIGRPVEDPADLQQLTFEPVSREELDQFVADEVARASKAIENKFTAFLDTRDAKLHELESSKENYKRKYYEQKNINQKYQSYYEQITKSYQELQEQNLQLHQKLAEYDPENSLNKELLLTIQRLEEELKNKEEKLIQLVNPSEEMRRKGQTIRAGDKTHEDIAKEFKDIYTNRQLLVPISMRDANQRAELLTSIFQQAYSVSRKHVIKTAKSELNMLLDPPKCTLGIEERSEVYVPWKSREEALSLLLSSSKISFPSKIIDEVKEEVLKQCGGHLHSIDHVIKQITELTWSMVTRSPPVTFNHDESLLTSDEMYERSNTLQVPEDNIQSGNCMLICRRPVLFFGPLGIIGTKGCVAIYPVNHCP